MSSRAIDVEGLFTHFSVADGPSDDERAFTRDSRSSASTTCANRLEVAACDRGCCTPANTAGTLGTRTLVSTWFARGIALYGYLPRGWLASTLDEHGEHLEAALTLRARVVARCAGSPPSATELWSPSCGRARADRRDRPLRLRRRLSPPTLRRGGSRCSSMDVATRSRAASPWISSWSTSAMTR